MTSIWRAQPQCNYVSPYGLQISTIYIILWMNIFQVPEAAKNYKFAKIHLVAFMKNPAYLKVLS